MANIKSNMKSIKTQEKARVRNAAIKSRVRTAIKKALVGISNEDPTRKMLVSKAIKELDQAVTKGVLHKNNASRRKSRLVHLLNDQPEKLK